MVSKTAAVVAVVCSLLIGTYCLSRDEIVAEYSPILLEHGTNLTVEKATILTEVTFVKDTLLNDTITTINLMKTQISTLQTTIASAKQSAANKTDVLNCIAPQETAAKALSPNTINQTCWLSASFEDLTASTDNFALLAGIPNNTIPACTMLDPLIPNQDEIFLTCLTEKILDFAVQLTALRNDFVTAKDATLKDGLQCLANESASLAQKINEINFQVTLCLTMG